MAKTPVAKNAADKTDDDSAPDLAPTTPDVAATPDDSTVTAKEADANAEAVKSGKKTVNDARKEAGKAPFAAAPYPTQDDLDAMRDGSYQNRELKSR